MGRKGKGIRRSGRSRSRSRRSRGSRRSRSRRSRKWKIMRVSSMEGELSV